MGVLAIALVACGSGGASTSAGTTGGGGSASTGDAGGTGGTGGATASSSGGTIDTGSGCADPPTVENGLSATLAPEFAGSYRFFNIGGIPGIPADQWFGTPLVDKKDPSILYFAARLLTDASTMLNVPFYSIKLKRDDCGHIIGFAGQATALGTMSSMSGTLVYGPGGNFFWDQFQINSIGQSTAPGGMYQSTAFPDTGKPMHGVSSIAFVPPGLAAAGQLRGAVFNTGQWYHFDVTPGSPFSTVSNAQEVLKMNEGPGSFAYIPAGSPGFTKQSIIANLWYGQRIVALEVDDQGDPILATQRDFFSHFDTPWGAYFEAVTGDFLLVRHPDAKKNLPGSLVIVQGFVPPQAPPK